MKRKLLLCIGILILIISVGYSTGYMIYFDCESRTCAGNRYLAQENYIKARTAYENAIRLSQNNMKSYAGLACAYKQYGLFAEYDEIFGILQTELKGEEAAQRLINAFDRLAGTDAIKVSVIDSNNFEYYNADNYLIMKIEDYSNKNKTSTVKTVYTYNDAGNISTEETCTDKINDKITEKLVYMYNADGKLINTLKTRRYDSGQDFPVFKENYFYSPDGTVKKIETYENNRYAKPEYWWLKEVQLYEGGYIKQKNIYKKNSYKTTYIQRKEFFDSSGILEKVENYSSDSQMENYQLYSYPDENTTVNHLYDVTDVLKTEVTEKTGEAGKTYITKRFDNNGNVVKTIIKNPDGTENVTRPYDDLINPRPLTEAEIRLVNENKYILGAFTGGANGFYYQNKFEYPADIGTEFLQNLIRDNWLTKYDTTEINNLIADGMKLNRHDMEYNGVRYHRISYVKAEQLLEKYLGLKCEDLGSELWDSYSTRYNAFYIRKMNDDYGRPAFECIGGVAGENYVKLYSRHSTLYLKNDNGRYLLQAHIEQDNTGLLPKEADYETVIKKTFIDKDASKSSYYNTVLKAYNDFIDSKLPDDHIIEDNGKSYSELNIDSYALYDITRDGIPELFTSVNGGGIHKSIYTYKNGKVTQLPGHMGNGMHGPYRVLECGMIGYEHLSTGITYFFTTYYKDGSTKEVSFSFGGSPDKDHCYINGERCTFKEYEEYAKEYMFAWNSPQAELEFMPVWEKRYI